MLYKVTDDDKVDDDDVHIHTNIYIHKIHARVLNFKGLVFALRENYLKGCDHPLISRSYPLKKQKQNKTYMYTYEYEYKHKRRI